MALIFNKEHIDIHDYISVIVHRSASIITFFVIVLVTVVIGTLLQKPTYVAKTVVMIEMESPQILNYKDVVALGEQNYYSYKDYYETQYKILKSFTIAKQVKEKTIKEKGEVPSSVTAPMVEALLKRVNINPLKNTRLVEILVTDTDPVRAAFIANTWAGVYMEQNIERKIRTSEDAIRWLEKKIESLRQDAEVSFKENKNVADVHTLMDQQSLSAIKEEYVKKAAEASNLAKRYKAKHPKTIRLQGELDVLKQKIDEQSLARLDMDEQGKRIFAKGAETAQHIYEGLLQRMQEARLSGSLNTNNIYIVDKAEPPLKQDRPQWIVNILCAFFVGLFGGIGIAFAIEYFDNTIKDSTHIEKILNLAFLGIVSRIEEPEIKEKEKMIIELPSSGIAEQYRSIRTNIKFALHEEKRIFLVTGAEPEVGKTITCCNLGLVFAQEGKPTLIIDGDLRKPRLHSIFKCKKNKGLSSYLVGEASIDEIIHTTEYPHLCVVPSGLTPPNPAELLGSPKMQELIEQVKSRFSTVIIDSAPLRMVSDATILAHTVKNVVFVVRNSKTLIKEALITKKRLVDAKASVLGVVLNDVALIYNRYAGNYYYASYAETDNASLSADYPSSSKKNKVSRIVSKS